MVAIKRGVESGQARRKNETSRLRRGRNFSYLTRRSLNRALHLAVGLRHEGREDLLDGAGRDRGNRGEWLSVHVRGGWVLLPRKVGLNEAGESSFDHRETFVAVAKEGFAEDGDFLDPVAAVGTLSLLEVVDLSKDDLVSLSLGG